MRLAWLCVLCTASLARAAVVQVPEGGRSVQAVAKGVVCGPLTGGWTIDSADRRVVTPPPVAATNYARSLDAKIADTLPGCATTKQTITLTALGPWPDLDPAGVTFWPDDGRLELRGQHLKGVQVTWSVPGDDKKRGDEVCLDAVAGKPSETCVLPVAAGLPADLQLAWLPAFAITGPEVTTYDAFGNRVAPDALRLRVAKVVLSRPLVQTSGIDLTAGPGRVVLSHPEAVVSVDCGSASCELVEHAVAVRGVPEPLTQISIRLRLAPRVFASRGDALDTSVTVQIPLLSCPMSVIAGTLVRDIDDPSAVVRLDPGCGRDPNHLRWVGGGGSAEVRKVIKTGDGIYVLLRLDRVTSEHVTITASRPDFEHTIVASATAKTVALAQPRVKLELPAHGKIDFVPTNRPAVVVVSGAGDTGRWVAVPVEGVYTVMTDGNSTTIRADGTEGFVSLRLAYRVPTLPGELATADLAVATERVQREMREAAVPAPIGASAYTADDHALVELVCADGAGKDVRVKPGSLYRIALTARSSCRVVLHQERLTPSDGSQDVTVEVEVTKADGTPRPDAKLSEHVVLRPGGDRRVVAIRGAIDEFDHIEVRVSHVIDESRYIVSTAAPKPGLLAAQWSAIVDGGHGRLYATATIPAGLYRVNRPSGQLTLNFGVLSRLTTLDRRGKEGLLGLELGVMGLGLAPQHSNVEFPLTLAIVSGLGIRVPLGQGATIGIQAWVAYEFRDGPIFVVNPDGTRTEQNVGPWSFIFGPSISFGNVGLNL